MYLFQCSDVVAELADEYHIFALDIIADINLSEPKRKISASEDFAKWLNETVIGLGIEGCYVMGESFEIGTILPLTI